MLFHHDESDFHQNYPEPEPCGGFVSVYDIIYRHLNTNETRAQLVERLITDDVAMANDASGSPMSSTVAHAYARARQRHYKACSRAFLLAAVLENIVGIGASREPLDGFYSDQRGEHLVWLT